MMPAFSTVACPDWTLERIAQVAGRTGALGVELRTFGDGATQTAGDPFLTSPGKTRAVFDAAGVTVCCLATGARFDRPVDPPLLGLVIGDNDRPVRETRSAVKLAAEIDCPLVRVFAFELYPSESRSRGLERIVERLSLAVATARNTDVRIVIENGGTFCTAADLAEIMDRVNSPLLYAAYSLPVALAAGDDPLQGLNVLGDRLASVKLKSFRDGRPVALGQGESDTAQRTAVAALSSAGFRGWAVYEFDRAWLPNEAESAPDTEAVLAESMRTLYGWIGRRVAAPTRSARVSWQQAAGV